MENARLKQISSYEENVSMRKELARVQIIHLKIGDITDLQFSCEQKTPTCVAVSRPRFSSNRPCALHWHQTSHFGRPCQSARSLSDAVFLNCCRFYRFVWLQLVRFLLCQSNRFVRRSTAYNVCPTNYYPHFASSKRLKSHSLPFRPRLVHWPLKRHCW